MISVVVPIYNVEKFLEDCLESIEQQTYTDFEVILVNDGSTDNSEKIAQSFVDRDLRFKLFNQENGGLSAARNRGILEMSGEFVTFIDSDDKLAPTFLETCLAHMSDDVDAVETGRNYITENSKGNQNEFLRVYDCAGRETVFEGCSEIIKAISEEALYQSAFPRLVRSKFFYAGFFPVGLLYEDLATTPILYTKLRKVVKVHQPLFFYRVRDNSITTTKFSEKSLDIFTVCDIVEDYFLNLSDTRMLEDIYLLLFKNIIFQYNIYMTWNHPYRNMYEEYLKKYSVYVKSSDYFDLNLYKSCSKYFYVVFKYNRTIGRLKYSLKRLFTDLKRRRSE